jgi:hypothetical protein
MKKILTSLFILCTTLSYSQIICIFCYDQNDSISTNVNNLVLNGSFESGCTTPGFFCPSSSAYNCDLDNWTTTNGGSSTYARVEDVFDGFSVTPDGIYTAYFGNGLYSRVCSPSIYDTTCLADSGCVLVNIPSGFPYTNAIYGGVNGVSTQQTVNNLIIGNTYVLEFWAGGEGQFDGFTKRGVFAVDIGFGKTFLRCKPTSPGTVGTRYIIEFNATSTSHIIKFTNWGHVCATCTEVVLDNIRLYTIAELDSAVPNCITAINETNKNVSVKIYPNPFGNRLNISVNNNELSEIILSDITSRILMTDNFLRSLSLNTDHLATGIYFYTAKNKYGLIRKGKIVKD